MKWAHHITITVFVKPEDNDATKEGLLALIPFDLEDEKVPLNAQRATGFNDRQITIYSVTLSKDSHIRAFLNFLLKTLSDKQKQLLIDQAETRLDEENNFYLRIDKEPWQKNKTLYLTDSGNCYHLKLTLATYPKKRDVALNLINDLLTQKDI